MTFQQLCDQLEAKIIDSYSNGVTLEAAERLAGEFLGALMVVSNELKALDLDSRMRKSSVKALRASVYLEASKPIEGKKPTEAAIEALINVNPIVGSEQQEFDKSEVDRDNLTRYYNIFKEAHVHFRGISKGRFE